MLNEALQKAVRELDRLRIPHALIGRLAVAARGAIRATQDVDLLVDLPVQEAPSLERSLGCAFTGDALSVSLSWLLYI